MMANPFAALVLATVGILGWISPEMQAYFRIKELLHTVQQASPSYDPELAEVALRARALLEDCGHDLTDGRLARRAVSEALREQGRFGLTFVAFDEDGIDAMIDRAREYFGIAPVLPGVGRIGVAHGRRTLAILAEQKVKLPLLPPKRWHQANVLLWGELPEGYRNPSLLMLVNGRELRRYKPDIQGQLFYSDLPFADVRRARIEVQAEGPKGAEVLALFDAGDEVGTGCASLTLEDPARDDPRETWVAERSLLRWVNELRSEHGLSRLVLDERASVAARAHSKNMSLSGVVGHKTSRTDSLGARLRRAGVGYQHAVENVAAAGSVWDAHHQLTRTPSHLSNMLEPDVTRFGVGVFADNGIFFVTEELFRP